MSCDCHVMCGIIIQVYARFMSPRVSSGSVSLSSSSDTTSVPVQLFYDPEGWDSVADVLVDEGDHVDYMLGIGAF